MGNVMKAPRRGEDSFVGFAGGGSGPKVLFSDKSQISIM